MQWKTTTTGTGMRVARGPNGEVAIEESCRRCGARVIGALDAESRGVWLASEPEQPMEFRNAMPFAGPQQKRHHCPKESR